MLLIDAKPPLPLEEIGHEVVAPVFDDGRFGTAPAGHAAAAAIDQCRHGDRATVQSLLKGMSMLLSMTSCHPLSHHSLGISLPCTLIERSHFQRFSTK